MTVAKELGSTQPPQAETASQLNRRVYLESVLGKHPVAHMLWPTTDYYSADKTDKVPEAEKIDFLTAVIQDLELAGVPLSRIPGIINNHGATEPTSFERGYVMPIGQLVHDGQFATALSRIEPILVQKLEEVQDGN
ncbi:MAG TPA: hypothetical protein PLU21_01215 [Candidatus Saccharibacteria bacterium]|nr:hypothetical protein [Candidatus Saccharibacteria bacterium]